MNISPCLASIHLETRNTEVKSGMKRSPESDGNSGQRLVKRVIFFAPPPPPAKPQDFDLNPPDLFSACNNPIDAQKLPQKFKDFARIFRTAWYAYNCDFNRTGECDFELTRWGNSPFVEALDFHIHLSFIKQIFDPLNVPRSLSTSPIWELIAEYIYYTFSRVDACGRLSNEAFLSVLLPNTKLLNPEIFSTLMQFVPKTNNFTSVELHKIWHSLICTAISRNLSITSNENLDSRSWFKLFYLFCLHFGAFQNLSALQGSVRSGNPNSLLLHNALRFQPLLSAIARHDSEALKETFYSQGNEIKQHILGLIDKFLELDQDFRYPKAENQEELAVFADNLFDYLCIEFESTNFSKLLEFCFRKNHLNLAQFLAIHSLKARASIPSKAEQCSLLIGPVHEQFFDSNFDFIKFTIVILAFDLNSKDIEEFLLPQIGQVAREGNLIRVLFFILELVESLESKDFPTNTILNPPSLQSAAALNDAEGPFILEVGRILLARHFRIAPAFASLSTFIDEEACYRDLAWFMNFFINYYRPDLGPDFKITVQQD